MPAVRQTTRQPVVRSGRVQAVAVGAGVVVAFALSLLAAGVIALIVYTTSVSEQGASAVLFLTGLLSLAVGAGYGARAAGTLGWVHGLLIGCVYVLASLVLTPLLFPGGLTLGGALQRLAMGAAVGALGGVLGVNL